IGWEKDRPHNEVSAEVAVEYLDSIGVDPGMIVKVGEIIMVHDDKETDKDLSLECRIVMDADLLDEVGAVGIMSDCMASGQEDETSYKKAYYRIKEYLRNTKPKIGWCKTDTGRNEFMKRIQLIEGYIYQLERELF
ncbi:MAG TPA: HD domain-containing protein, partial [Lachnospiraceae bacterium]|nr:HD domain-containing protein [Lachnospiraceae bacterium]